HRPGPATGAPLLDGALATMNAGPSPSTTAATTASSSAAWPPWTARPTPRPGGRSSTTPAATTASAPPKTDLGLSQDRVLDAVESPVQVVLADDQRRREPDHGAVGFLGKHAAGREPLAHLAPGQRRELEPGPHPAPAHAANHRGRQRGQPAVQA